ncbi:hypothetical protein POX_h09478 [Penicillium oxalicum]|uniref:Uncharacterized protein n=1 Tax=Penicillium oxalicum (strain 114-2 / CGMCC 5302) TaxID=933388 RepID=S7ZLH3_PENO1|nr:hypothetical protein POX_h09478 [Penicillium oxalicum]EPS31179.1 hypothetical protein PDE_06134 [Penicillium oxalicum 114-2]KAI2785720.1 hypothetical protein POX_h09478 [Penicillium oxalicum]
MSSWPPNEPKTLGRTRGSINAPIAAFTMAVILCSYCFSSIRTARREAQDSPGMPSSQQRVSGRADRDSSWMKEALEESRGGKSG